MEPYEHRDLARPFVQEVPERVIVGGFRETDQADKSGRLRELLHAG
jgi:hypothetical protein